MAQYVMSMLRVSKVVPPKRQIIKDISSFFQGAKIGLLGLNGSGKSTVLRIMAGVDEEFDGETTRQAGIRIGYLPQSQARRRQDGARRGRVRAGRGARRSSGSRRSTRPTASPTPTWRSRRGAGAARGDRRERRRRHRQRLRDRRGRAAPAAVGSLHRAPLRRREAPRRAVQAPPVQAGHAALDEPTNHLDAESVEAWSSSSPASAPWSRSRDRYFLDNAAEWILELDRGRGILWKGNYSSWLEQKEQRLEVEAKQESARIKARSARARVGSAEPEGAAGESRSRLARFEELSSVEYQKRNETQEIFIPVAERLGEKVIEFKGVTKGFGDRLLMDDLPFIVPPGAIVGIIGPNGAASRRCSR